MLFTSMLGTRESLPGALILAWSRSIPCEAMSELDLLQDVDYVLRSVTAFDVVIPMLGLHPDSQGTDALVYALLQYAAPHSGRRDSQYGSPCKEVLHRLRLAGVNENALAYLARFFNTADDAYSRR